MAEYIEREAFIESQQHLYCENCARRKDGKGKFVYDIGDAPCRACGVMDVLDAVEDAPAADVRAVVYCEECKHKPAKEYGRIIAPKDADGYTDYKCPFVCEDSWYNRMPADDDYCSCGEKREES